MLHPLWWWFQPSPITGLPASLAPVSLSFPCPATNSAIKFTQLGIENLTRNETPNVAFGVRITGWLTHVSSGTQSINNHRKHVMQRRGWDAGICSAGQHVLTRGDQ